MIKYLAAYGVTAVVLVALDLLWLGVIALPFYQQGIGHLMAAQPNVPFVMLFYAVFVLGLTGFAVAPQAAGLGWRKTMGRAALFGFFTYATYDLTNLATLKNWPIGLSLLDISWGVLVSSLSAAAGKAVLNRYMP